MPYFNEKNRAAYLSVSGSSAHECLKRSIVMPGVPDPNKVVVGQIIRDFAVPDFNN